MNWLKQILTGANNETMAIGRFIGIALLVLVVITPVVELITIIKKVMEIHQWADLLDQWQVFMPIMIGTATGVIAGTAFTEPKCKDPQHDDRPRQPD